MEHLNDKKYLDIVLSPIRISANYKPKFGQGSGKGYTLEDFRKLYQSDPFYNWFGLDNPLMYAAHKAAGGMTSIYRQIGIGCEALVREIYQDSLGLTVEESKWSYDVPVSKDKTRTLYLDGRIPIENIVNPESKQNVTHWLKEATKSMQIAPQIAASLTGAVFEVRQGYKSKDSKRQNADLANAATAYTKGFLPCIIVLSTQIDEDVLYRYRSASWLVLTGTNREESPLVSTYSFFKDVVGYDLASFFTRNSDVLRLEIHKVLEALLGSE